jgi:iron(III) transport system ATP-binding protein
MISVQNVTKRYEGNTPAVNNVSFAVEQGEIVALLGPSGCGKTTILRCIAGFEQPTAGEVYIDGRLVSSGSKGILTPVEDRGLGFVHQSYALWPHRTVFKNVAYPLELRKWSRKEIVEKVHRTLEIVHLEQYAERYPSELSGGEQQRVALARSIVYDPSAILLDEPLSNLDAKLREQTRFELRRLFKELHVSALYVTHDQSEALAIADRCMVMRSGKIEQSGNPIELYTQPASAFVADFMGSSNILKGLLSPDRPNSVDLGWGVFQYGSAIQTENTENTENVMICIRPKDVSLTGKDPQRENIFPGKITVRTFAGDFYKFLVRPVGRSEPEILVHVYDYQNALSMQEGSVVYVHFPPPSCLMIV